MDRKHHYAVKGLIGLFVSPWILSLLPFSCRRADYLVPVFLADLLTSMEYRIRLSQINVNKIKYL